MAKAPGRAPSPRRGQTWTVEAQQLEKAGEKDCGWAGEDVSEEMKGRGGNQKEGGGAEGPGPRPGPKEGSGTVGCGSGGSQLLLCESRPAETRLTVYAGLQVQRPSRPFAPSWPSTFVCFFGFCELKK